MCNFGVNQNKTRFCANAESNIKTKKYSIQIKKNNELNKDTLLENNLSTRMRIQFDKLGNACTMYPAKGFKGSKNANFYEFLTMGTVPYLIGSGVLIAVFNYANKFFPHFDKSMASSVGKKMGMGVAFYAVAKELAKPLISKPVKWMTGVDVDVPYAKVEYQLPEHKNDTDITSIEHHKVLESVEFPRFDLLYNDEKSGKKRLAYFDNVAKKLNRGENIENSDKETKGVIRRIAAQTTAAKNTIPYLWAATGVMLAFSGKWDSILSIPKVWKPKSLKTFAKISIDEYKKRETKDFKALKMLAYNLCAPLRVSKNAVVDSFKTAGKNLWKGGEFESGFVKHFGKGMILTSALATTLAVYNIVHTAKTPDVSNKDVIDEKRKYTVD